MTRRLFQPAALGVGLLLFAATMAYPALAMLGTMWTVRPAGPAAFGSLRLLLESAALALAAALLAVLLALPAALGTGRLGTPASSGKFAALLAAPVLFPPMVYVFGWQSVLHTAGRGTCIAVWATWIWPLPAALLGAAWLRRGRALWDAARLDAPPLAAVRLIVLPVLAGPLAIAVLLVWAVLLGEYTIPHACGLIVHATDLLARVESATSPVEVFAAAAPGAGLIAVLLGGAALAARARRNDDDLPTDHVSSAAFARVFVVVLVVATVGIPLAVLARRVPLLESLSGAVQTYGPELLASLAGALAAGTLAVWMGISLVTLGRLRRIGLAWGVLWAALPGALVGELLVTAYLRVPFIYDTPALTILGWTARYGWIGIAAAWLARTAHPAELEQAAAVDGATPGRIVFSVALGSQKPLLAAAGLVVAALSLSDVATTALVRSPRFTPISMVLIEKFHRLEDRMLVAISLLLVGAAFPAILVLARLAGYRQGLRTTSPRSR